MSFRTMGLVADWNTRSQDGALVPISDGGQGRASRAAMFLNICGETLEIFAAIREH
jgi:hypothetical protein